MPDEPNGNPKVEEKQPASMPEAEQTQNDELPSEASDRTKEQFDKLKDSNKQLSEELKERDRQIEELRKNASVFDTLKPEIPDFDPTPPKVEQPKAVQADEVDSLIDQDGYVDANLLKTTLKTLRDEVNQVRSENKKLTETIDSKEESSQVKRAHKKYPQLDPKSDQFDPKFFEAVKNDLVGQMIRGEKDLMKAADRVSEFYPLKTQEPKKESGEEEKIRQISAAGNQNQNPKPKYSSVDESALAARTRKGDRAALLERLKRAGA